MLKNFISLLIFLSIGCFANAQSEDVTLIFKRPGADPNVIYTAKININGKDVCNLDSDRLLTLSCSYKVDAGEVSIKIGSRFRNDFEYLIDVQKNKTYTLIVYSGSLQMENLIWKTISDALIKNKANESPDAWYSSFKTRVITIE